MATRMNLIKSALQYYISNQDLDVDQVAELFEMTDPELAQLCMFIEGAEDHEEDICPHCNGTGDGRDGYICRTCGGEGVLDYNNDSDDCRYW